MNASTICMICKQIYMYIKSTKSSKKCSLHNLQKLCMLKLLLRITQQQQYRFFLWDLPTQHEQCKVSRWIVFIYLLSNCSTSLAMAFYHLSQNIYQKFLYFSCQQFSSFIFLSCAANQSAFVLTWLQCLCSRHQGTSASDWNPLCNQCRTREKDDTRDHTPFVLPLTHSKLIMPSATHQNGREKY